MLPGVLFCQDVFKTFLLPPLVSWCLAYLASRAYGMHISIWVSTFIWILTLPIFWWITSTVAHFMHTREARKLGAQLVPTVRGKLPGNLDILWALVQNKPAYIGDGFLKWSAKLGTTFQLSTFGDKRVLTINPENIKQILATDFDNFVKGKTFNETMQSVLGVGVFNSDGDMWRFHRKITRPYFAKERVTDFSIFDAKSVFAVRKMDEYFARGQALDFQDIASRFTLDSACEFLLGAPIHALQDPLPQPEKDDRYLTTASSQFAQAFAQAQVTIASRGRLGMFWRFREFLKDHTDDNMVIIKGFIEPIVQAALKKKEEGRSTQGKEVTLLDHLVNVTDDKNIIVDEVLNIMLAGRDTTASLLTFVTYCLAMHPDVLVRLREEIISHVGKERAPTHEDLRAMKYLRAVLNETLRLFPPVPFNVRQTLNGTVMINDQGDRLYVPPKTRVTFAILHMQRHEPYWGPDANNWDPDRFLDERVKRYLTPNPFIFLPFNAGPRICLGQQFAYHEASFFIVRMLQHFGRIELATDIAPPSAKPPPQWATETEGSPRKPVERCFPKSHLTLYANGGLWVRMGIVDNETV